MSEQPQEELFVLLNEHLQRLEAAPAAAVLPHLAQAVFQLLILAGIMPQVHACCVTQRSIVPELTDPNWQIGFSIPTGGIVTLAALEQLRAASKPRLARPDRAATLPTNAPESGARRQIAHPIALNFPITGRELALLQQLAQAELPQLAELPPADSSSAAVWLAIERLLRNYTQFHFDRPVRSATLIDACFLPSLTTP